ncbi:unnamed protein product [Rotaria sordida]|uniref:Uncharacterized protein n=1 Tax=Rotaria sordida TaxID=392033 RepID=A0A813R401_9BILA|nr:unnamed protein product [Rotaria sordida]
MMIRLTLLIVFLALITLVIANEAYPNGWPVVGYGAVPNRLPSRWFARWHRGRLWGWDNYYHEWHPICFWHNGKCN